ncbi:MAG TPA: protein kinase [Thermoanaerobaculia bacterium]|nr:protein kinase [Thermoanaerobaculia bacterium]
MTPERWQQIQRIFEGVADRPSEERADWLAAACGGDLELHREVESLLAHEVPGAGFLEPLIRDAAELVAGDEAERAVGRRIGPYRVTGVIGHGGMGTVFLAVRDDDQYRKQVAIKLVRQGMATDFALRRFRQERQILAGLEHPHIARLLEGGATAEGLPYFAMEYVRGEPITEYCRSRKLSIASRLKLFRQVCSAVQYAHQTLVIHRDLKPSNILVAEDGTPKLLDFGIAKLVSSELDETDFPQTILPQTVTAMRMLTPDYASPEQVRGEPMTTATDVYSLGVVLYELLTDRRPHRLEDLSMAAIEQVICTGEVEKPSTAARRDGATPERWRRQLSGDLDTIVGMAMRKESGRRYASVEQLSEDLRRYLEGLPVMARSDSFGYRTGKLVRRHKLAIGAAALVVLSLIGGIAATAYQARRAERRFEQVRKLAHTFLFDFHDKIRHLPGSTEAREMLVNTGLEYLDSLSAEAGGDLALQLELAEAYQRVGAVQGNIRSPNLGRFGTALETHRKALRLAQGVAERQPADLPTLRVLTVCYLQVGDLLAGTGDIAGGIAALHQSLGVARMVDARRTGDGEDLLLVIRASELLGDAQLQARDIPGALRSYRTGLELSRRRAKEFPGNAGAAQHGLSLSYSRLGDALVEQGDLAATLDAYREALRIRQDLVAAFPSNTTYHREMKTLYNWLGNYLGNPNFINMGDEAAALRYYRQGLVIAEEMAAVDPKNALALYDLATSYAKMGDILTAADPQQGAAFYRRSLAILDALLQENPGDFKYRRRRALYQRSLAAPLRRLADRAGALRMLRAALDTTRALAAERPENAEVQADLQDTLNALGDLELELGDRAAALQSYQRGLAIARTRGSADLYSLWRLAESCSRLGGYHESLATVPAADRMAGWRQALAWHQKALDLWAQWPKQAVSSAFDASRREKARLAVARAQAALAGLDAAPAAASR